MSVYPPPSFITKQIISNDNTLTTLYLNILHSNENFVNCKTEKCIVNSKCAIFQWPSFVLYNLNERDSISYEEASYWQWFYFIRSFLFHSFIFNVFILFMRKTNREKDKVNE